MWATALPSFRMFPLLIGGLRVWVLPTRFAMRHVAPEFRWCLGQIYLSLVPTSSRRHAAGMRLYYCLWYRSGEDKIKGPEEERDEEFATGPLSLLMQVSWSCGATTIGRFLCLAMFTCNACLVTLYGYGRCVVGWCHRLGDRDTLCWHRSMVSSLFLRSCTFWKEEYLATGHLTKFVFRIAKLPAVSRTCNNLGYLDTWILSTHNWHTASTRHSPRERNFTRNKAVPANSVSARASSSFRSSRKCLFATLHY